MAEIVGDPLHHLAENDPWQIYRKGREWLPYDPFVSKRLLETAFHKFKNEKNPNGLFLSWSAIIAAIGYGFNDLACLDDWIEIIHPHFRTSDGFPSKTVEARVTAAMFAALVLRQSSHEELAGWEKRALLLEKNHDDIGLKIQILIHKVIHEMLKGNFDEAGRVISILEGRIDSDGVDSFDRVSVGFISSFFYQSIGLNQECDEIVTKAVQISQKAEIRLMEARLLGRMASNALDMNNCRLAEKLISKLKSSLSAEKVWEAYWYHFLMSRYLFIRGNNQQAAVHVNTALTHSKNVGFVFFTGICHLLKARIMHRLGPPQTADHHYKTACSIAEKSRSNLLKYYCELTRALADHDRKEAQSSMRAFQNAVALSKKGAFLNSLIDEPAETAALCEEALNYGIEVQYVQHLIRTRKLAPLHPPHDLEEWPWPIKIYTLGRFSLVTDGRPVRFSRKGRQRQLTLLKVLIAMGGREVKQEMITDILWPDADGDVAHQSFNTTLHRLRGLMGNPDCLKLRNNRLTLDPHFCWVDAWAFERIIGQIDKLSKIRPPPEPSGIVLEKLKKAVDLYKGCFLSGEEDPWAIILRERLKSKFMRSVGQLAGYYEKTEEWEQAIVHLKKSLEIDLLAEESHQRLMALYLKLGRTAEALSAYNRCNHVFTQTYGITPSADTEKLRKAIFTGKWN